jgi:hypothetical protein
MAHWGSNFGSIVYNSGKQKDIELKLQTHAKHVPANILG